MGKRLITDQLISLDSPAPKTDWANLARITTKTDLPPIVPTITIDETWACTEGEIMQVSGQKKAGKSNVLKFMIATALMPDVDPVKTLGIRANYTTLDVVFVDTEQSRQQTQSFCRRVVQIADLEKEPPNLFFYNIRHFDIKERMEFLTEFLFVKHLNGSLIVIDGITDFVDSVNNEEMSKRLIDSILKVCGRKLSIVLTIHEGKDGNGARGHIGQELERKCVSAISISKDRKTKTHKMSCKLSRYTQDFEEIIFQYDNQIKDFRRLDALEIKATQQKSEEDKNRELKDVFDQIFATSTFLAKSSVIDGILNYDNSINKSTLKETQKAQANRRLKRAIELGIVQINSENMYHLND